MDTVIIIACSVLVGAAAGYLVGEATIRHLRRRLKELRAILEQGEKPKNLLRSVTRFLFVTTQVFAIIWVSWSYIIATYSTVVLMQPFPVEELSRQAITTLLGMSGLKVVENIFEHNEGPVFGRSSVAGDAVPAAPPESDVEDDAPEG